MPMTLPCSAVFGCPQAIAIELREVLPAGWTSARGDDAFVVRGPMREGWRSEIWRIMRFVAYPTFVSLEEVERGSQHVELLVVSQDGGGQGFRIRFLLAGP